jgi:hypothetical protein
MMTNSRIDTGVQHAAARRHWESRHIAVESWIGLRKLEKLREKEGQ